MAGQAVVEVAANSEVEIPASRGDRILNVQGQLFDVGVAVERIQASSAGQIEGQQQRVKVRIRRISKARALRRAGHRGTGVRSAIGIQAHRVEGWIDDAEVVVLVQKRLLVGDACLKVVDALHVGEIGTKAGIGQGSTLSDAL